MTPKNMTLTPALETEIEDMGGTALEATDEAITFSRGDVAYAIRYGSGSAKFVVNGNNWDDDSKSYTGSYRIGQASTLEGAVKLCK